MTSPRVIPSNIAAEQALLGAILVKNEAFDRVSGFLEADHFHEPFHREIFGVISKMLAGGRTVTPITMKSFLPAEVKGLKLDGEPATAMQYLARLVTEAVTILNARDYGLAVYDAWIARRAISALSDGVDLYYNLSPGQDVLDAFAPIEEQITAIRSERIRTDQPGIGKSYIDSLQASYKRRSVNGVPIALEEIATVISEPAFEAGNLYGLLSSSGEGKTSLTVQIMSHAIKLGHPVLFLSYDQNSDQVVRQMVAQTAEIEARRQRDASLLSEAEFTRCMTIAQDLERSRFEVIKCTDQSAPQLVGYARTFVKRRGNDKVPLVVVDHMGAVKPDDRRADEGTKAKAIGQILKSGAEMTTAAWFVLNQRNSFGMKRDNPRPISMDLFGGDPAKTPFDAILYLYRFKKYLEERKAVAGTESDWKKIARVFPSAVRVDDQDIAEIGAIKVRFGSTNITERLLFEPRFTRYKSLKSSIPQEALI